MKKIIPIIILIIVLGLSFIHWDRHKLYSTKIFVMDTIVEIHSQGEETHAREAMKDAADELGRIDSTFGYSDSLIQELNAKNIIRNHELYNLVRMSLEVHKASAGAFSLTLRPILDAWGFTDTREFRIPGPDEFDAYRSLPDDSGIVLGEDGETIQIQAGTRIDLGGITKGYAADSAALIMKTKGIHSGLINAGGDITAFGDRIWRIGIKHPRRPGIFATIPIRNKAIATSGDYERFFVEDGRRYCHILDPATGRPPQIYMSTTILADNCIDADAWATALFVKGLDSLENVLIQKGMDWIVIDQEGKVSTSPALREYCPDHIEIQ